MRGDPNVMIINNEHNEYCKSNIFIYSLLTRLYIYLSFIFFLNFEFTEKKNPLDLQQNLQERLSRRYQMLSNFLPRRSSLNRGKRKTRARLVEQVGVPQVQSAILESINGNCSFVSRRVVLEKHHYSPQLTTFRDQSGGLSLLHGHKL